MEQRPSSSVLAGGAPFVLCGWRVDPASLRISNAKGTIKLEPRAMAVLDYLACRQGEVISRQELEEALWAGTIVGYDALGNAINKLRKSLGDKARKPRIIETISKSGYRLIAEVSFDSSADTLAAPLVEEKAVPQDHWQPLAWVMPSLLALVISVALWWQPWAPNVEPASLEKMAFPLPDKPSIAVLPFVNLSNDAEQEYFADGMTEDLITDISKVSGLFVIARNSVFSYKDKAVKIRQVAEELGVRYVLEGSVRRAGNQVRINAQLIDATSGGHVWAERYDGALDDVFSMQDKITQKIVTALAVTLSGQELGSLAQAQTTSTRAYDAFLRGWELYRRTTPDNFEKAISYFEQAIALDPNYGRAHTALAAVYWDSAWRRWTREPGLTYSQINEQARQYLQKARQSPSALAHQVASEMATQFRRKPEVALRQAELAIALDINDPAGYLAMANALMKADRPGEAILHMQRAMRLDPHFPASYLTRLGRAQFSLGQYQQAAATLEWSIERNPQDNRAYVFLAATYGHLGRIDEAKTAVTKVNSLRADTGWDELTLETIGYWKWTGARERLLEGLAPVGLKTGREWYALITRTENNFEIEGADKIDVTTAKLLFDKGVLFVDPSRLFYQARIPGAHHLLWSDSGKGSKVNEFNKLRLMEIAGKTREVVIYGTEFRSVAAFASAYAVERGFPKVYYFESGLEKWKAAGYPVESRN